MEDAEPESPVDAEALGTLQPRAEPAGRTLLGWLRTIADPDIDVAAGLKALREARDER